MWAEYIKKESTTSREIDHKIWENLPHTFERQPGKMKGTDDYQFRSCLLGQKAGLLQEEDFFSPQFSGFDVNLTLPSTKCEANTISGVEDYDLKYATKKAGSLLTLPLISNKSKSIILLIRIILDFIDS